MTTRRTLVTGATGFIGSELCKRLERPRVLARDPMRARSALGDVDARAWDADRAVPEGAVDGIEVVFHLAGEPVAGGKWDDARRARVKASRVNGTRAVVDAMRASSARPRVLVAASAVGFYGSRGDEVLTEESAPGEDFLGETCRAWEAEALAARELGVRVVLARIGLVLGRGGGPLAKMLPPFRLGLGGPLGTGAQYMPWIHLDDVVGLLLHAAEHAIDGPMNLSAPEPVTNRTFTKALARALHRPAFFRAPEAALRLALGDFTDVVLASQRAVPAVALRTGYRFAYADLDAALRAIVAR
jgi:uncharacterized protein (TIGR01777 family)